MTLLASFFLPSHLSLNHVQSEEVYVLIEQYHNCTMYLYMYIVRCLGHSNYTVFKLLSTAACIPCIGLRGLVQCVHVHVIEVLIACIC